MYIYLSMGIYLFLASLLALCFIRSHLLKIIILLELLLLASCINFVVFSYIVDDIYGHIYTLMVFTVAAAESSLGLALLVVYYRVRGNIAVNLIPLLKS